MVIEVGQKQNREERNYLLLAARINNYSKKKKGKTKNHNILYKSHEVKRYEV